MTFRGEGLGALGESDSSFLVVLLTLSAQLVGLRRVEVMNFQKQAASFREERAVTGARRATRVRKRLERFAASSVGIVSDRQVTVD